MLWILANHVNPSFAFNEFAFLASFFYGWLNFHKNKYNLNKKTNITIGD